MTTFCPWRWPCAEHGKEISEEERAFIVGHSWNEIHAKLQANHNLTVSMSELIAQAVAAKDEIIEEKGYTLLPGVREAVARLGAKVPLAVVSGASHGEVEDAVTRTGLLKNFAFIMGAEDYGRGKPDPEPYAKGMSRLGVNPAGTLILEDANPGVRSGVAAGGRVVGIQAGNFVGADLSAAHAIVDTLDDVDDDLLGRLFV